ncbi:hypothetical protein [Actinophytocola oryzae]|nr:hypothetical protein [Actinophytocola oryzae]
MLAVELRFRRVNGENLRTKACDYRPPTEFETLYELGDLISLLA